MARTKPTPKTSPTLAADPRRDIPILAAREANTPQRRQELLSLATPSEMPIPTDWNSERIKEAQKSQRTKDLEKAQRIIRARLDGKMMTAEELAWATKIGEEEQALEKAENEAKTAGSSKGDQGEEHDRDKRPVMITSTGITGAAHDANSDTDMLDDTIRGKQRAPTGTSLTASNLGTLNAMSLKPTSAEQVPITINNEDTSSSSLSTVSDVSALDPSLPAKKQAICSKGKERASSSHPSPVTAAQQDEEPGGAREHELDESEVEAGVALQITAHITYTEPQAANSQKDFLARALDTIEYDESPEDRPYWLPGLRKPLPHPELTALQNFEVQTRFWFDEIARLEQLRSKLTAPKDNGGDGGEWYYEHFGNTIAVEKRIDNNSTTVFARGVWKYIIKEELRQQLDEYPLTLEGELLGWNMTEDLRKFAVEDVESGNEEVVQNPPNALGSLDEADERDGVEKLARKEEDVIEVVDMVPDVEEDAMVEDGDVWDDYLVVSD